MERVILRISKDETPAFSMIRGDEMPEWLVEMIKSNNFFAPGSPHIVSIDWSDNPNFWLAVSEWQRGDRAELPEEPK